MCFRFLYNALALTQTPPDRSGCARILARQEPDEEEEEEDHNDGEEDSDDEDGNDDGYSE